MAYLAFYRAFRPVSFDTVVRQEHIVRTLKNQIASDKIGHAYLFCGPRGTGKTTLAKIFARAINCEAPQDGSPCGKCPTCKSLAESGNLDVYEIDAASNNGVDEMRDLREKVQYPPVAGRYKVYIIDEVHMLTASAFNAVLKTLEEPPRHAVFILATTEPQKIPATILSRCMRFDFKLLPQKDMEGLVKSVLDKTGKQYEDEAVSAIARAGAGSARDSLSIADMCASYSVGKLTYADVNAVLGSADFSAVADIAQNIMEEDCRSALTGVESILSTGKSVGVLIKDLLGFLNNCAIIKMCKNAREIVNLPEETYGRISRAADVCDGHKILRVTEILAKAETDLKFSLNGRITLETAVLKCAMPQSDYNIDALIGKINLLEKKLAEGIEVKVRQQVSVDPAVSPAPTARAGEDNATEKPANAGTASARYGQPLESETAFPPYEKPRASEKLVSVAEIPESEDNFNPFKSNAPSRGERAAEEKRKIAENSVQPSLWDGGAANITRKPAVLSEAEKGAVFGKFIRLLRTTRKNAVLFTLCMDLGNFFEGEKLVLTTDSEAVYKGLTRADNAAFISETLAELGVGEHEVRIVKKGASPYDRAVEQLKRNFEGVDVEIK